MQDNYISEYNYLKTKTDGYEYLHYPRRFYDDKASVGLSHICRLASDEGKRIYISGSGADETLNDYGTLSGHVFSSVCVFNLCASQHTLESPYLNSS